MIRSIASARALVAVLLLGLAACGPTYENGPPQPTPSEIAELERALMALGDDVSADEAARAARLSFTYPLTLAERYQIEDPPIIHNMKVNRGLKPRGLCYQWADDMQAMLLGQEFETLVMHRAIANAVDNNPLNVEHSTVILSGVGDGLYDGIIIDPWRWGGRLFWSPVTEDPRYSWLPRDAVFAEKRRRGVR